MADRPGLLENIPATPEKANVPAPRAAGDGSQAGQAEEHRAPLAWWHLRYWRKDVNVLARIRGGLVAWSPGPTGPARLRGLAAHARSAGRAAGADASEAPACPSLFAAVPPAVAAPLATPALAEAVLAEAPWTVAVPVAAFRAEASGAEGSTAEGSTAERSTAEGSPGEGSPAEASSAEASSGQGCSAEGSTAESSPDEAPPGEAQAALPDPVVAAVRKTFAMVAASGDAAPGFFYGWLFAHYPRLRDLFPPAMNDQRDRLVQALIRIVESLSTPEEMAAYLAQLGRDHRKYGVEPAMYEAVGGALLATLRAFAGPAFTPAAEQAWKEAYEAISALMIKAAEDASALAPAWWSAEVVANDERYRGISVLTIAPDQALPFQAGQHITVQTPRWPRVWRPYSIAGCPRDDGLIQLHVRAIPGGWVSNALVNYARPGQMLTLGPPLGTMTLPAAGDRDLLCVAGGTGLSPVKAIIEQAVRDSAACPRQIYLFCGARQREELYDLPDLWRLADAWPGLNVIPVTSGDPAFDGVQGNVGRVAARYLPHRDCEAYVAGPPAMVRETIDLLGKAGLPRARIHFDDAVLAGARPECSGHQ